MVRWSTDIAQADWWLERLGSWPRIAYRGQPVSIETVVPDGFEAIARVFHPVEGSHGTTRRWAEVAAENGRVVHPYMQLHAIGGPESGMITGELSSQDAESLAGVLAKVTDVDAPGWFATWDGYGDLYKDGRMGSVPGLTTSPVVPSSPSPPTPPLVPFEVQSTDKIQAPIREYFLMEGSLSELREVSLLLANGEWASRTPNLWWPADQSWFVISEIDFYWTYVAGSAELVDAVLAHPNLEAMVVDRSKPGNFDELNR